MGGGPGGAHAGAPNKEPAHDHAVRRRRCPRRRQSRGRPRHPPRPRRPPPAHPAAGLLRLRGPPWRGWRRDPVPVQVPARRQDDRGAHAHDRDEPGGDPGAGARAATWLPSSTWFPRAKARASRSPPSGPRSAGSTACSSACSPRRCCARSTSKSWRSSSATRLRSRAGSPAARRDAGAHQPVVPPRGPEVAAEQPVQDGPRERMLAEGQPDHRLAFVPRSQRNGPERLPVAVVEHDLAAASRIEVAGPRAVAIGMAESPWHVPPECFMP